MVDFHGVSFRERTRSDLGDTQFALGNLGFAFLAGRRAELGIVDRVAIVGHGYDFEKNRRRKTLI